jgi:hypothetical protein
LLLSAAPPFSQMIPLNLRSTPYFLSLTMEEHWMGTTIWQPMPCVLLWYPFHHSLHIMQPQNPLELPSLLEADQILKMLG